MDEKYRHGEAYCIMTYESDDGSEIRLFWNSRDGVTPFTCNSPYTGKGLTHKDWTRDVRCLDLMPRMGSYIWVDMTQERMREVAGQMAALAQVGDGEGRHDREIRIRHYMAGFHDGEPDLVRVTKGMAEMFRRRAIRLRGRGKVSATETLKALAEFVGDPATM